MTRLKRGARQAENLVVALAALEAGHCAEHDEIERLRGMVIKATAALAQAHGHDLHPPGAIQIGDSAPARRRPGRVQW